MTLDAAIKHCLEVAEQNETSAIAYKNCKEIKTNMYEKLTAEKAENDCQECAADHRQIAEWLTDYEGLRSEMIDLRLYVQMLEEYREKAKRLLKVAVKDIHKLLCDKKNLDGSGQSCNTCSYIEWCPCSKECNIREDLRNWRYADEALKLIGEDGAQMNNHGYVDVGKLADFANNTTIGLTENEIMSFPKADVQPIEYGRWEYECTIGGMRHYHCTNCDKDDRCIADENQILWWKLCPKCGARMERE